MYGDRSLFYLYANCSCLIHAFNVNKHAHEEQIDFVIYMNKTFLVKHNDIYNVGKMDIVSSEI